MQDAESGARRHLDSVQARLHHLARRDLARNEVRSEFGHGELIEHKSPKVSHSTIFGTRKS